MTAATPALRSFRLPIDRRLAWILGIALVLIVAAIVAYELTLGRTGTSYLTQPVVRQTLSQTVSASGTVNPQDTVAVGSQVSGIISEIDVDFNSKVHKGEVLARLDPSTLQAQLSQATAGLAQARAQAAESANSAQSAGAGIPAANAEVAKAQSAVSLAQANLTRDTTLYKQGYVAQNQVQADQDAVNAANATLQAAHASAAQAAASANGSGNGIAAAQANVAANEAQVQQVQLNLARSIITSPVDGTVIGRDVSVGQTVAASLQTPTLFTIAQDLTKMEVDIAVGEPDIGSVRPGENVDFTVLAYPNRTFHGTVSQVRKQPTTVSNVVTYTVITKVDNQDGALLPGMTATATIDVATAKDALVVPLAALQFHPAGGRRSGATTAKAAAPSAAATPAATASGSPWGQTTGTATAAIVAGGTGAVYVQRNGAVVRVPVTVGLVAGTQASVTPKPGSTLAVGDAVIVGSNGASTARAQRAPSAFGSGGARGTRGIH